MTRIRRCPPRQFTRFAKHLGAATLITLSALPAAACDTTTSSQSPPSAPPQATATTSKLSPKDLEQLCNGLTWPRPMPAVVGSIWTRGGDDVKQLTCLDGLRGVGPDGSILYNQKTFMRDARDSYRITAVSPPPGTPVGRHDPVTVTLVPVEKNAPVAYQPCDWVTTAEAAEFLGGIQVITSIDGYELGSTDIECMYASRDKVHEVSSELRLTGAQVVDAASEFAFNTAENATSVSGLGMKAACTLTPNFHELFVLLPGERMYVATGWGHESCDTLTQFARKAIPRIGA
jgi:hypothetical protein